MNRKTFLRTLAGGMAGVAASGVFRDAAGAKKLRKITILHTNDTHGQIEPLPSFAGRYAGLGGVARRKTLIDEIRSHNPATLLLDAGDAFQGTPFFEEFGGGMCYHFMSELGYDAATIGDDDFDDGIDGWMKDARKARFPFVSSNYRITNEAMAQKVQRYLVREVGGVRIGVFGLGISLDGLAAPADYEGVIYENPVPVSRAMVKILREKKKCDFIICLSHLGFSYPDDRISDVRLAHKVPGIDLIIGGHTRTFLDKPVLVRTSSRWRTLITQVGFGGIVLGHIDFYFDQSSSQPRYLARNAVVGPPGKQG